MDAARIAQIRAEAFEEAAAWCSYQRQLLVERMMVTSETGHPYGKGRIASLDDAGIWFSELAAAEHAQIAFEALDPDERAQIEAEHETAAVIRQRELDPMRVSSPWIKAGKPRKRGK
jgi:hypothetical protein